MEVSDIIALSKAGFSATQIAEMVKQEKPQEQKPQEQKPQEMTFEKIYEEINKLRQAVTDSNIKNSNQPKTESVDDILKNFINDKE